MTDSDIHPELVNNLIGLLKHLNFSDIHIQNHSRYSNPEFHQTIIQEVGFTPFLIAQKNGVIYFFEFVDENFKKLKHIKQSLQKLIELGSERWDADFVLVTRYGNKDTVQEWCQSYNLPVNQIWEM